jgi:adenosine kinase
MSGDIDNRPSLLGLCNPLLDISAYVDQEILDKYKLDPNNAILAGDEHKNLCKELVEKYPVEYSAGGSAQNVMRVAAGILKRQGVDARVMFSGCIGNDEFGSLMSRKAAEDGVIANYAVTSSEPTGTCAVCLTENGKNRSLCAFLGASQKFTDQHLIDNWDQLVAKTDLIYMTGFLIASSPRSFHLLGEHVANCDNDKRRFCLNLSAPYVSAVFGEQLEQIMKYVDILFGNDDEALAYAKHKKWDATNVDEIATKIALGEKQRKQVKRLVIITRGGEPIIAAQQVDDRNADVKHFPCKPIPSSDMVDTNGAGDSFAGGFLSQYVQGAPLERCIEIGDYAAREIIKVSGIAVPDFANLP